MYIPKEKDVERAFDVIKQNLVQSDEAIKFIKIKIGLYRVEAEKNYGFVRSEIHKMANDLEKELKDAIAQYIK
jgi:hypothetical protein